MPRKQAEPQLLEAGSQAKPGNPQAQLHDVLKPIVYRNPKHKLFNQLVQPGEAQLTFEHLDKAAYDLLILTGIIGTAK